jgi:hypothetical protein
VAELAASVSCSSFEFFGGFVDLLAGLFELLLGLGHVLSVLGFVHALFEVVEIAQELLLLGLEAFELVFEFLLLFLGLGLGELVLQLLHFLGQRLLTAGEFLEAVQNLQVLLLLGGLFLGGGFFFFVALLFLFQLQIHDLVLVGLLRFTGLRRAVLTHDLMLAALRTVQPFERGLLKGERLIQAASAFSRRRPAERRRASLRLSRLR